MKRFSIGSVIRRRWTVIVAVLVVAVAGFGVYRLHGIFGSNDVVSWPRADSIENSK
ncbi:MmpS family transport accessory protein [Mycobacterium sp. 852002-50816_SCH5313054-b]|uniref:MmpS family transport accessory protein n=1 Tax=Mycobacterium sp. 852002-50816_SCH5313054-b TaxID=1834092 RepID=UPI000AD83BEC|nr:MmpS family transport accessory protein [Mycobacterium sp. 852002-50816_SCH5313054-b]